MSAISNLYERIALISPRVEVIMRRFYWYNVEHLKRFKPYKTKKSRKDEAKLPPVDFDLILSYLKSQGIEKGDLLVVHSSYDSLRRTGLTPEQIIDKLLELVGPTGTLAMPAMRKYKGEPEGLDRLRVSTDELVCTYKPRKTMVKTGWLPLAMVQRKDSVVSRHPLDTMVAIGPLANAMMEHNLEGENPASHGPNSSWKFCYDHQAKVIGLGVDLHHFNSICHVNEEALGNWKWSDEEWYRLRKFNIIDGDFNQTVTVRERKPEWGMLRLAEINAKKDKERCGLISYRSVDGIDIYVENAQEVVNHLQENNKKGIFFYV